MANNEKKIVKKSTIILPLEYNPVLMRKKWRTLYETRFFNLFASKLDFDKTLSQDERIVVLNNLWNNGTFAITKSPAPMEQFKSEMKEVFSPYAIEDYDYNLRPLHFRNTPKKASLAIDTTTLFRVGTDGVLIYANEFCALHPNFGIRKIAARYIDAIVNARMTQNTNLLLQKMPFVFACDSEDQESFKRMMEQVFGDVPALYIPKSMGGSKSEALSTNAPYVVDKMDAYITRMENMFLDEIGIDNVKPVQGGQDRLAIDEANANNSLINHFSSGMINTLMEGFENAKTLFGRDIRVKSRDLPVASIHEEIREEGNTEKVEEVEE